MNYRFDFKLTADATIPNECWSTDAHLFMLAAERAKTDEMSQPWLRAWNHARLMEYARAAFCRAEQNTIGHGKADRYAQQAQACHDAATHSFREATRLWDELIAARQQKE